MNLGEHAYKSSDHLCFVLSHSSDDPGLNISLLLLTIPHRFLSFHPSTSIDDS